MTERKRFLLRVDALVFDEVERWAGDDLRSINAQIEYLLMEALRRAGRTVRQHPQPLSPLGRGEKEGGTSPPAPLPKGERGETGES